MSILSKLFGKGSVPKPVFRLDESGGPNLPPEIADNAFIVLGPLAEKGLSVFPPETGSSIIIATHAASLRKLPERMPACSIRYFYPTRNVGGLSAANKNSVEAWGAALSERLGEGVVGKVGRLPTMLYAPCIELESVTLLFVWAAGVSSEDLFQFAQILERDLR